VCSNKYRYHSKYLKALKENKKFEKLLAKDMMTWHPATLSQDTSDRLSTTPTKGRIPQQEIGSFDMSKFVADKPDLILTNGMAYKYIPFIGAETKMILNEGAEVFKVKPGELTRWYIVNAGPRGHLSFNFAGDMVITDRNTNGYGNISKSYMISIPPGSAQSIEAVFPETLQEHTYRYFPLVLLEAPHRIKLLI
jgi:hypothetical protein